GGIRPEVCRLMAQFRDQGQDLAFDRIAAVVTGNGDFHGAVEFPGTGSSATISCTCFSICTAHRRYSSIPAPMGSMTSDPFRESRLTRGATSGNSRTSSSRWLRVIVKM